MLQSDGRLDISVDGCNEMYCDETTSATNIPFGTNIPRDNRNRIAKATSKKSAILTASHHLEFVKVNI
jgi:hypothetical protein